MNNIIYVIDYQAPEGLGAKSFRSENRDWVNISLPSIHRYGKKWNIPIKVLGEKDIAPLNLPSSMSHYQKATFLKILSIHDFLQSPYERMAHIDLDIYIKDDALNIFDYYPESLVMSPGPSAPMIAKNRFFLEKKFNCALDPALNYNWNMSVFLLGKDIALSLLPHLPPAEDWEPYLKRYNLVKNDFFEATFKGKKVIKYLTEQDLFSFALIQAGITPTRLHSGLFSLGHGFFKNKKIVDNASFLHFSGNSKPRLVEMFGDEA
jgi:hypothetical protein